MKNSKLKYKKSDQIVMDCKRWFEKTNGNTYHSTTVYLNGKEVASAPYVYGYGNHCFQTGFELLKELGYPTKKINSVLELVTDVNRKKDL